MNKCREIVHVGLLVLSIFTVVSGSLVSMQPLLTVERDEHAITALHASAQKGDVIQVDYLLSHGADDGLKDERGWTPFHKAAEAGHREVLEKLSGRKVHVDEATEDHETPLLLASRNGHHEAVKFLLSIGASIDIRDKDGNTSLHYAALRGNCELCELLIGAGIPPLIKNNSGQAPIEGHNLLKDLFERHERKRLELFKAAYAGDVIAAKRLIASRAPLATFITAGLPYIGQEKKVGMWFDHSFQEAAFTGLSPLSLAALRDHLEFTCLLFTYAKSCGKNDDVAALCCASLSGHRSVVEYLLGQGVSPKELCWLGINALHAATLNGHAEIVKLLLAAGADPVIVSSGLSFCLEGRIGINQSGVGSHTEDPFLVNALYLAGIFGYTDILDLFRQRMSPERFLEAVRCLLPTVIEKSKCDAEKCASVVKKMIDYGVNITFADAEGNTLLHRLGHSLAEPVLKVFLEAGADLNVKNLRGWTPLQCIYMGSRIPMPWHLKLLFKHGADFSVGSLAIIPGGRKGSVADYLAASYFDRVCESLILCVREGCYAPLAVLPLFFKAAVNPWLTKHLEWLRFEVVKTGNADVLRSFLERCYPNNLPMAIPSKPLKNCAGESFNFDDPLFFAVAQGYPGCVDLLLEKNICSITQTDYYGNTALHYAAKAGHKEIVDLLVNKYRAPLNIYNKVGQETLMGRCSNDPYVARKGQTPYDLNPELIGPYLKAQDDVHKRESSHKKLNATSNLIAAVTAADLKGVESAIAQGADINAQDMISQNYVIHIAIEKGDASIVQCLRSHGVDMSKKNVQGQTAEEMRKSACIVQ